MARRKFDEVVEEETTVTEEVVEETPDLHEKFVTLLVEMGLSAEQAEAVHSMAMDLIDAGEGEIKEEEEKPRQLADKFISVNKIIQDQLEVNKQE